MPSVPGGQGSNPGRQIVHEAEGGGGGALPKTLVRKRKVPIITSGLWAKGEKRLHKAYSTACMKNQPLVSS